MKLLILTAVAWAGADVWEPQGPAPIAGGQIENIADGSVSGAVNTLAPHPDDAAVLYLGSPNGGIWKTESATAMVPQWVAQTEDQPSGSIGSIRFDPTDAASLTLVAGFARSSAFNNEGGSRSGVLRTVDGGATWTLLPALAGRNLIAVEASGDVLVAASNAGDTGTCEDLGLYRSVDAGVSFTQVTAGIPGGVVDALARDPNQPDRLFAAVYLASLCTPGGRNGIYRSDDFGATWQDVTPDATALDLLDLLEDFPGTHAELAVGAAGQLFVAIAPGSSRQLEGVFFTRDGGASWQAMSLPGSQEPSFQGVNPGRQGFVHLSIATDPANPNFVYVGGDRQPQTDAGGFPNSIGANDFTGRLFRGDTAQPPGFQWTAITHLGTAGGSAPHADSRELKFDAAGGLLDAGDGGIYRQSSPAGFFGDWFSLNGNLAVTEAHAGAADPLSDVVITGNQDTGTSQQEATGEQEWAALTGGDGGDVALARDGNQTIRYRSAGALSSATRAVYEADGTLVSETALALTAVEGDPDIVPLLLGPWTASAEDPARLAIAGANGIYESVDRGDTLSRVLADISVNAFAGTPLVYGPSQPELLAVAGCPGACLPGSESQVYIRQPGQETFAVRYTAQDPRGVTALAPAASGAVFVLDGAAVVRVETDATTEDLSSNLETQQPGRLRDVRWVSVGADPTLLVGTDRGVFAAFESGGYRQWTRLGDGLPPAPVMDLDVTGSSDVIAVTLGRGVFRLPALGRRLPRLFQDGFE
ncbi:MAG: hypothetical protein AAGA23_22575 [Pseudomonadota bacterium]